MLRREVSEEPTREEAHVGLMRLSMFSHNQLRGSRRELTEIKRALAMTHLLTLTGAGGSGKTSLALKVATDLASAYRDEVGFVGHAGLSESDLAAQEIADAVGARWRWTWCGSAFGSVS